MGRMYLADAVTVCDESSRPFVTNKIPAKRSLDGAPSEVADDVAFAVAVNKVSSGQDAENTGPAVRVDRLRPKPSRGLKPIYLSPVWHR